MCVYIYIYIYTYRAYVHINMKWFMQVCMYACMYVSMYVCTFLMQAWNSFFFPRRACMYVCVYMLWIPARDLKYLFHRDSELLAFVFQRVCMYVCIYASKYVMNTCTWLQISLASLYITPCVCFPTCMYVCMYICK